MVKIKLPKTYVARAPRLKQQRGIILHTSKVDIWLLELKLLKIYGEGNYCIDGATGLEDRLTISAIRDLEPEEIKEILRMQRDDPGDGSYEEDHEMIPPPSDPTLMNDGPKADFVGSLESSSQDTQGSDDKEHKSKPRAPRREWWKRSRVSSVPSVEMNVIQRRGCGSFCNQG